MAGIARGKIPRSHWVCAGLPATGEGMSCHYIATRGKLNAAALSYGNVGGGAAWRFLSPRGGERATGERGAFATVPWGDYFISVRSSMTDGSSRWASLRCRVRTEMPMAWAALVRLLEKRIIAALMA